MIQKLDATVARQLFSQTLSRVQFGGVRVLLHRSGKPAVVLVPLEDLALLESKADIFALQDALEDFAAGLKRRGAKLPAALAKALRSMEKLESRLAHGVAHKALAEADAKGEKPVPYPAGLKEAGF